MSDTQIGAGAAALPIRLQDQEATLNRIADLAYEREVDVVVHVGDVFERRNPSEAERLIWKRFVMRSSLLRRLVVVAGNHDRRGTETAIALDQHDEYYTLVRQPAVIDLGGCSLACLPWAPLAHLLAAGVDRDGVNERASELLIETAGRLRAECPDDKPALLALHWWVEGAGGIDYRLVNEPVLPTDGLAMLDYDQIFAGHVHAAEFLGESGVVSVGSPSVSNFAEADLPHGVWICDLDDSLARVGFVQIPDRPFLTVDVDLADPWRDEDKVTETDWILESLALHAPLTDAVVRIRVRASDEQWRRVDTQAVKRHVEDAGGRLVQLVPELVRAARARVEGVDESLAPAAAVRLWSEAQKLSDRQRDSVLALLDSYLAAA
jgi:DNA repair exonuclease SbcCD nuclease subunit